MRKNGDNPGKAHSAHYICSPHISSHYHSMEILGGIIFYLIQKPNGNIINLALQIISHLYISSFFHDHTQFVSDYGIKILNIFMFKNVPHVESCIISI
jgi:hypothetical protein